LRSWIILGKY